MWPKSDFLSWQCEQHKPHGIWSLRFTSICGTKSDIGQMFCNATTLWTVMSDFMQLLRHSRSTFDIIPQWRETLQRFYIPKVIRRFVKGNQWKCDMSEPVLDRDKKSALAFFGASVGPLTASANRENARYAQLPIQPWPELISITVTTLFTSKIWGLVS